MPTCPELVTGLSRERERLDEAIDDLETARANLDAIIAARALPADRQ
ncbi:hypothetical protein [Nonomuraea sp. NPDC046570]